MASDISNYPDFVFIAYDEDFSAQTYDIAVSLEPWNLVGRPVKYIRHDLNTRPAPAATDTGLKTIGFVPPMFAEGKGANYNDIFRSVSIAENYTAVVTRSQAEELLAAERAEKEIAERNRDAARENFLTMQKSAAKLLERAEKAEAKLETYHEEYENRKVGYEKTIEKLEADNAAKDARIKELTGDCDSWRRVAEKLAGEKQALEAKLAAAHKALEPFADIADLIDAETEGMAETDELIILFHDYEFAKWPVSLFRKARAVLGGKPS